MPQDGVVLSEKQLSGDLNNIDAKIMMVEIAGSMGETGSNHYDQWAESDN